MEFIKVLSCGWFSILSEHFTKCQSESLELFWTPFSGTQGQISNFQVLTYIQAPYIHSTYKGHQYF